MITIHKAIVIRRLIQGFEKYGVGDDGKVYNLETEKVIKQSLNNGCIGYWFSRKFVSLKRFKELLYRAV